MSREGRAQPIQPFAAHGFLGNIPPNGVLPGVILVAEAQDRQFEIRWRPTLQPFVGIHGWQEVAPPPPDIVEPEDRRRQGRRRPALDPVVGEHGFLGNIPPNGTLPDFTKNVDRADQRVRYRPLDPIVISGVASAITPPATPPSPFIVPAEPAATETTSATSQRAFSDPGPQPVGTTPPPILSLDRPEQRVRRRPLDSILLSGALTSVAPPAVTPVPPTIVPVEQRRRQPVDQPEVSVGFDAPAPPDPQIVTPDDRRRRQGTPDPFAESGATLGAIPGTPVTPLPIVSISWEDKRRWQPLQPIVVSGALTSVVPPTVFPPSPTLVEPSDRRRLPLLPASATSGFLANTPANFVTPTLTVSIDRAQQRHRLATPGSIVLSGVLVPSTPVTGVVRNLPLLGVG